MRCKGTDLNEVGKNISQTEESWSEELTRTQMVIPPPAGVHRITMVYIWTMFSQD